MKNQVLPEYIGDISTEVLLRAVTNFNPNVNSMHLLLELAPDGFSISAEFERPCAESTDDMNQLGREADARIRKDDPATWQPRPSRLVRLVLQANEKADVATA
jgi:hypothetical protein